MRSDVEISSALLSAIRADALAKAGRERCGLLFGSTSLIDAFAPAANVAGDPARAFEIDPAALLAAHRAARDGGPRIVGHYHSHPIGPALPSPRDAECAAGDGALWLIVTATGQGVFRAAAGGSIEGAFEAVDLVIEAAAALHPRPRLVKRAVPNEDSPAL